MRVGVRERRGNKNGDRIFIGALFVIPMFLFVLDAFLKYSGPFDSSLPSLNGASRPTYARLAIESPLVSLSQFSWISCN